ncbi:MAG: hypothetical protein ABI131_06990 [Nostocoides sp.]
MVGAVAAAAGAVIGAAVAHLAPRSPLGRRFERTNHAGHTVSLAEGPAYVIGAAAAAALAGPAPVIATLGAGAFGAIDDFAGDSRSKGLTGHLGALGQGQVTTGAVKILGIGASGLVAACVVDRGTRHPFVSTLVGGAVIAGAANLGNLLDLRPGRALKVVVLTAAPVLVIGDQGSRTAAAAAIGTAFGLLPEDLAGRTMLGDTGANAAGALVGTALVGSLGLLGRLGTLAVLGALTIASENVSFTKVIESTPVLRQLDAFGRRG